MTLPNKAIDKQPYEAFFISGSILYVQNATETISVNDSSVAAEDKNGADVSTTLLDQETIVVGNDPKGSYINNMLSMRVRAGDPLLYPYKVTFYMQTTEGNKYESDRIVDVEDT